MKNEGGTADSFRRLGGALFGKVPLADEVSKAAAEARAGLAAFSGLALQLAYQSIVQEPVPHRLHLIIDQLGGGPSDAPDRSHRRPAAQSRRA